MHLPRLLGLTGVGFRTRLTAVVFFAGLCVVPQGEVVANVEPLHQTATPIQFTSEPMPLKLPPGMYFIGLPTIAVNSQGHVITFARGTGVPGNLIHQDPRLIRSRLMEFGADGAFLREIGKDLFEWSTYAHVRVDTHDDIWVIDKGAIVKFTADGVMDRRFGRLGALPPADTDSASEQATTALRTIDGHHVDAMDIAWDKAGNLYLSDQHVVDGRSDSRIITFSTEGRWLGNWGGSGDQPGQFVRPHSIAIDSDDHIFVADNGNRRIQVFNTHGQFIRQFMIDVPFDPKDFPVMMGGPANQNPPHGSDMFGVAGAPWAICLTKGPNPVLFVTDQYPGRIYKLTLDGAVLGVLSLADHKPQRWMWFNEMTCPSEHDLWVVESNSFRHLILH